MKVALHGYITIGQRRWLRELAEKHFDGSMSRTLRAILQRTMNLEREKAEQQEIEQ